MSRRNRRIVKPGRSSRQNRPRLEVLEGRELLTAYPVTTALDSGAGSLRAAIAAADMDGQSGSDSITFNITGSGVHTINLSTALPAITRPLSIDGTSEPGFAASPLIAINGSAVAAGGNGLSLSGYSGGSVIRGLSIGGFKASGNAGGTGIFIASTSAGNVIRGDYLGVAPDGSTATPNALGIEADSANNTIGGTASAADVNVISGNTGDGVLINGNPASRNVIYGDYIGVNAAGTGLLGNVNGVVLAGPSNTLGGTGTAIRNVISGNVGPAGTSANVLLEGISTGNIIEGNDIGTDVSGSFAIQSGFGYGIYFGTPGGSSTDNVSQDVVTGNLISGNFVGVTGNTTALLLQSNGIGVNSAGTAAIANGDGIFLGASGSTIGGANGLGGGGNLISGNAGIASAAGVGLDLFGDSDLIEGNVFGLALSGTQALPNTTGMVLSVTNSTIGSTALDAGNTISGNTGDGITLDANGGNLIVANTIGSSTPALVNGGNGISITLVAPSPAATAPLALGETIGGTTAADANVITGNKAAGIVVFNNYGQPFTGLTIRGNSISANGKLGIDLNGTGTPIPGTLFLTRSTTTGGQTTLNGAFQGTPGVAYAVDFFGNTTPDASGSGQGQYLLGSATLTPDGGGLATINQTFANPNAATSFTATVTSPDGSTSEFSLNNPTLPAVSPADLAVNGASSPASIAVGGTLTFTETITNNGPAGANGVTFHDTIPVTLVNAKVTTSAGTATINGETVTGTFGTLASGASVTVTITGTASQSGSIINLAGVGSTTLDSNYLNNEFSQSLTVNPGATPTADLVITETATPMPATVGSYLSFTLTITNNGPTTATNVNVNDFLPANATLANVVPSQGGFASLKGTLITDNLGTIASGASATIQIIVTPTASGTLTNAANVSGNQLDPVASNNSTTLSVATSGGTTTAGPVLTLTQTPTPTIGTPGQTQLFTLTVHNGGTTTANGVTLVDALPANSTFVLAAPSQGGYASLTNGVITDPLGTLAPGATATLTLVLIPKGTGVLVNFAALVSTGVTPVYSQAFLVVPSGPSVIGVVGTRANSQVIVNFNEPLNAASASNASNYKLYALGHSPRAITSKDKPIKIKAITYISQTHGVVFSPNTPLDPTQYYTLVVVGTGNSGITDISGRKLIGSGSGAVGSNFSATFLASSLPQI